MSIAMEPEDERLKGRFDGASKKWPANSLRFYRESADMTLTDVAKALKTNHQTIQRLETGKMRLTPEWAERIGEVVRVPKELLAFSDDPDAYGWAVKAVPVVGSIDADLRINFSPFPVRRIGVPNVTSNFRALELGAGSIPAFTGWTIVYDDEAHEHVSQRNTRTAGKGRKVYRTP